jgi:hypothetical protein
MRPDFTRFLPLAGRFILAAAFLSGGAATLPGQTETEPPPTPTLRPANSTVRGRVTQAGTGQAQAGAQVTLQNFGDYDGNSRKALSDANGEFVFTKLRAGTYILKTRLPGAVSGEDALFNKALDAPEKADFGSLIRQLSVAVDGENETRVTLEIEMGGFIKGRVAFSDGEPAVGVNIVCFRELAKGVFSPPVSQTSRQTDDRGIYRLDGLPAGRYIVLARISQRPPYSHETANLAFHPAAQAEREATPVTVRVGQETLNVDIRVITERRRLAGRVKLRGGRKVEAGVVTLERLSEEKATTTEAGDEEKAFRVNYALRRLGNNDERFDDTGRPTPLRVDKEGRWSAENLLPGRYRIVASVEPQTSEVQPRRAESEDESENEYRWRYRDTSRDWRKTKEVALLDTDVTDVEIELGDGFTLTGRVRLAFGGPPDAPVTVTAYRYWEPTEKPYYVTLQGPVRPDGSFAIEGLQPGRYWIGAYFPDTIKQHRYYLSAASAGGLDLTKQALEIGPAGDTPTVEMVVSNDAAELILGVRNPHGPEGNANGVRVCQAAVQAGDPDWYCYTYYGGYVFSLKLPPREYIIFALPIFPGPAKSFQEVLQKASAQAQRITLLPGQTHRVELVVPD